ELTAGPWGASRYPESSAFGARPPMGGERKKRKDSDGFQEIEDRTGRIAGRARHVMVKATVLALALVLAATAAHAADACYQGVGGNILVFKRFKLPRANDCLPITGYTHNSNCTLSGTACGTSDGIQVNFNVTQICHFSNPPLYSLLPAP